MEYDTHLIGQRIKEARKAKRYTQDYVSAQANIGEKFLSQIECGNAGLSVQTLLSLCNILEVSPNYILLPDPSKALENMMYRRMPPMFGCMTERPMKRNRGLKRRLSRSKGACLPF